MLKASDIYIIQTILAQGFCQPDEIKKLLSSIHRSPLTLKDALLEAEILSSHQWKRVQKESSQLTHWPESAQAIEEDNQKLIQLFQKRGLSGKRLEQVQKFWQAMRQSGRTIRLDQALVQKGVFSESALLTYRQSPFILFCSECRYSFQIRWGYRWWKLPCPFCQKQLLPRGGGGSSSQSGTSSVKKSPGSSKEKKTSSKESNISTRETRIHPYAVPQKVIETQDTDLLGSDIIPSIPSSPGEVTSGESTRLGRYDILQKLGEGGMGAVFKAYDREFQRTIAIKILTREASENPEYVRRFEREARVVAKLKHSHIVPIYEVDEIEDIHFFTMKYVEGKDLRSLVEDEGKFSERKAVEIMVKVADAVRFAHSEGVIHRDIKPENIMIDKEGEPILMDFGLARNLGDNTRITRTGIIVGSPEFMSPEQARGDRRVSFPADLYALGGVLYYLLSGRPPFKGRDMMKLLSQVISQPPTPLHKHNPLVSRDLETIVHRCLEKEIRYRYRDSEALYQDLEAVSEGNPIEVQPPGWGEKAFKWTRRNGAAIVMVVLLMAASGLGFWSWTIYKKSQGGKKGQEPGDREREKKRVAEIMALVKDFSGRRQGAEKYVTRLVSKGERATSFHLLGYINSKHFQVRRVAIEALGKLGNRGVKRDGRRTGLWLLSRLRSLFWKAGLSHPEVVEESISLIWALGRLKEKRARSLVLAMGEGNFIELGYREKVGTPLKWLKSGLGKTPKNERDWLDQAYLYKQRKKYEVALDSCNRALKENSDFPEGYNLRGMIYAELGEDDKALEDYNRAIRLRWKFAWAYKNRAMIYIKKGKFKKGEKDVAKALDFQPNYSQAYYVKAVLYFTSGEREKGIKNLEKAIELQPRRAIFYGQKGEFLRHQKKYDQALEAINRALELWPRAQFYMYRAMVWEGKKNYEKAYENYTRAIEKDHQAQFFYKRGNLLAGKKKYKKAEKDFLEALRLDRKFYKAYRALGLVYQNQNQLGQALEYYSEALKINPKFAWGYFSRANVYVMQKRYQLAIRDYNQAIKYHNQYSQAYANRGRVFHQLKQYRRALSDYNRAIQLTQGSDFSLQLRLYRASLYLTTNQWSQAIADYTAILNKYPQYVQGYLGRAEAYRKSNQFDRALSDIKAAHQLNTKRYRVYCELGHIYFAQQDYEKALQAFNRALEVDKSRADAYNFRGKAYIRLRKYEKAEKDLQKALSMNPKEGYYFNLAKLYYFQNKLKRANKWLEKGKNKYPQASSLYVLEGRMAYGNQKFKKAIQLLSKALQLDPYEKDAYLLRGQAHYHLKNYSQALKDLSVYLRFDPHSYSGYHTRGSIYIRLQRWEAALKDFTKCSKISPQYYLSYDRRGKVYLYMTQYEKALADFNKARKLNSKYHLYYYNRGWLYSKMGKEKKAVQDLKRFLKLQPRHPDAPRIRDYIKKHK